MRDVLNLHNPFPASPHQVALFIANNYGDGKKHTTILNYIPDIAYQHKISYHLDPTSSFLVQTSFGS